MVVSFTPTKAGMHQVSVTFRGRHLQRSPLSLKVIDRPIFRRDYRTVSTQPICRFGSKGFSDGQFNKPESVACNSKGKIVVVDRENHRIQVFDRKGKFLFKFGAFGKGNDDLQCPEGVTVDQRNNDIVVADFSNHRIQIFDENGTFLFKFGSEGKYDGQ